MLTRTGLQTRIVVLSVLSTLVMLAEGSVFPRDGDRPVYGAAPVVKEQPFRVRHNGFGYTVGCAHVA